MVPDWAKADMEQIVSNVAAIDWITVLDGKGAIDSWDLVKAVIEQETEKCIPKKRRRTASRPLWMTRNIMRLIRKKRRVWREMWRIRCVE